MREATSETHYLTRSHPLQLHSCQKMDPNYTQMAHCIKSVVLNHCHLCNFSQRPVKTTHLTKNEIIAIFWGECISSYG